MGECRSLVVKLGGGLITRKERPREVDLASLSAALDALARYRDEGGRVVAVVHGGGSFGHHEVGRIKSVKGRLDPADSWAVQRSMLELALIVAGEASRRGFKPVIHPPHTYCNSPGDCRLDPIARDYSLGLHPLTYGDAIPVEGGVAIVSGDRLARIIAEGLGADCLVYAMRGGGVVGRGGHVLPRVRSLEEVEDLGSSHDYTGGIKAKVSEALLASRRVRRVVIVGVEGLYRALKGEEVGTRVG